MEEDDPLPPSQEVPSIVEVLIDGTINVFYAVCSVIIGVIALLYVFGI